MPPKVRVAACSTGCGARSRRPVGRPPYVPLFGLCVGRGDPTPPKSALAARSTDGPPSVVGGGVPDAPRVYGKRAFTGNHRAGQMFIGWGVGEGFIPPGMLAAAETSAGRRGRRPLRLGRCPGNGQYRKVAAACGQAALRAAFLWPPVQRMAAGSAPSVVGGGVPDAPRVHGKRVFTGSHRAGHARPLPRGFGRRLTPSPLQFLRPSGSCGPAAAPRCLRAGASPSTPDPAIGRTCTRCASPLPSF